MSIALAAVTGGTLVLDTHGVIIAVIQKKRHSREKCHETELRRGWLLGKSEWEKGKRKGGDRLLRTGVAEEKKERQREGERWEVGRKRT